MGAAKLSAITIFRGGAIGDFVLTLPAINAVRRAFPAADLRLIGRPATLALGPVASVLDGEDPRSDSPAPRWAASPGHAPALRRDAARASLCGGCPTTLRPATAPSRRRPRAAVGPAASSRFPRPHHRSLAKPLAAMGPARLQPHPAHRAAARRLRLCGGARRRARSRHPPRQRLASQVLARDKFPRPRQCAAKKKAGIPRSCAAQSNANASLQSATCPRSIPQTCAPSSACSPKPRSSSATTPAPDT